MGIPQWIHFNDETGIITIDTGTNAEAYTKVQRLDSYGSVFEKIAIETSGSAMIDTGPWPCGTWFIRVEKKQEVQLKRIIIK